MYSTVIEVNPFLLFMQSFTALLIAIGMLLGAIILILKNFRMLKQEVIKLFKKELNIKKEENPHMEGKTKKKITIIITLFSLSMVILLIRPYAQDSYPTNVMMMIGVWEKYNKAKKTKNNNLYQEAIAKADELIEEFEARAEEKQNWLIENKVEVPKEGKLTEEQKEKVFDFGPLHEVSAAWWIKGRSLQELGQIQEAIAAYESASEFPHALVYDPSWKGFWSPANDAKARANKLRQKQLKKE